MLILHRNIGVPEQRVAWMIKARARLESSGMRQKQIR
jgi:hypothetical protein